MVKLQAVRNQFTISIPRDKVTQAGWKKGDTLTVDYDKRTNELIIAKLPEPNNNQSS